MPTGGMPQMGATKSRNRDGLSSAKTKFQVSDRKIYLKLQIIHHNVNTLNG